MIKIQSSQVIKSNIWNISTRHDPDQVLDQDLFEKQILNKQGLA
jgi:hypothetical protein